MCYHYSMFADSQKLASHYKLKTDLVKIYEDILKGRYHINAFSNPLCYTVTESNELQTFYWGLIPFWEKTLEDAEKVRTMTYNARSETIFEKASFKEPIKSKRCLIPSTGYFEYHHNTDKSTSPYYIFLRGQEIFSMAGIYDTWENKQNGDIYSTFSIITTDANPLVSEIHNGGRNSHRMPVILSRKDEKQWLETNLTKEDIKELMIPFDAGLMDAYRIDNNFIKKHPNDESIIEKITL